MKKICKSLYDCLLPLIIEDIKKKKAIIIGNDTPASFRIAKMVKKGWQIEAQPFQIINLKEAYDGYCVICHEDLEIGRLHIKDRNCDARFHMKCYLTMIRFEDFKHECPLCKAHCIVTSREQHAIELINNMDCRANDDIDNLIVLHTTHVIPAQTSTSLFGVQVNNIRTNFPPPPPLPLPLPLRPRRNNIRGDMTTQEILMDTNQRESVPSLFEDVNISLNRF
jgi:hypothetical protein